MKKFYLSIFFIFFSLVCVINAQNYYELESKSSVAYKPGIIQVAKNENTYIDGKIVGICLIAVEDDDWWEHQQFHFNDEDDLTITYGNYDGTYSLNFDALKEFPELDFNKEYFFYAYWLYAEEDHSLVFVSAAISVFNLKLDQNIIEKEIGDTFTLTPTVADYVELKQWYLANNYFEGMTESDAISASEHATYLEPVIPGNYLVDFPWTHIENEKPTTFKALMKGECYLLAKAWDKTEKKYIFAGCKVTIKEKSAKMKLDNYELTVPINDTFTLLPTIEDKGLETKYFGWKILSQYSEDMDFEDMANYEVKYAIDQKSIIYGGSNNYLTTFEAKKLGTYYVVAYSFDCANNKYFHNACKVTINNYPTLQLDKTNLLFDKDDSDFSITPTIKNNNGISEVEWYFLNSYKKNWETPDDFASEINNTIIQPSVDWHKVSNVGSSNDFKILNDGNIWIVAVAYDEVNEKYIHAGCHVTVRPRPEKVLMTPQEKAMYVGDDFHIQAEVYPSDANQKLTWKSLNNDVVTVDQKGNVHAVKPGKAKVHAIAYTLIFGECEITVSPKPITEITLEETDITIEKGKTHQLKTNLPEEYNDFLTWESENESVATVKDGLVTGIEVGGPVEIRVRYNNSDTIIATCNVQVIESNVPVIDVTLDKSSLGINMGHTYQLNANILPENATDKTVTWTSDNPSVATVVNGLVKGLKPGPAKITVKTNDGGYIATCNVIVNPIKVTGITLNKSSFTLFNKCTFTLKANTITPSNATNKTLKWTSNKTSVATVDPNSGKVTAKAVGTATITCSSTDGSGVKTICTVKVIEPVTKIDLNKYTLSLKTGKTFKIIATVTPSNSTYKKVTWVSSNTSIATVGTTGIVTAKGVGECEITAIAKDGSKIQSKPCVVTVTDPTVTLNKKTLTLNVGKTFKLIATVNLTNKKVTWSSSDSKIATVGSTGIVKGIKKGTVTITATSVSKPSEQAICKVTVK